jgi:hypothetical protein
MEIDFLNLSKKSLEQTESFIQQYGPRLTGSESCQKVAENWLIHFQNSVMPENCLGLFNAKR